MVGRLFDLADVFVRGLGRVNAIEKQLAIPADDGEEIIKVVSHPSCQPADRLHLLRLAGLFFQVLALRDVNYGSFDERWCITIAVEQTSVFQNPHGRTVFATETHLQICQNLLFLQLGREALAFGGTGKEFLRASRQGEDLVARGISKHSGERFVAIQDTPVECAVEKTSKIAVEKQPVALFRLPQGFFGLLQIRNQGCHLTRLSFSGAAAKSEVNAHEYKKDQNKSGCD